MQVLKFVQTYSRTGPPAVNIADMVAQITDTMKDALALAKGSAVSARWLGAAAASTPHMGQ